jgi:flagellar hook-associated protein 3 FlgL
VRITQNMLNRTLLSDLQNVQGKLSHTQQELSSGKSLMQPSDDPFATSRALQLQNELAQNEQYQRNVSEANSWQSVTDTALGNINDDVQRARDLVVQAANDTSGTSARNDIAAEITQLIDSIKTSGNTQYAGRYVFSGSATLTQPYTTGASDAYGGNAEVVKREIGPNVQIDLNQPGISVIGDTNTGILNTLRTIVNDLQSNNGQALQTTDLQNLDAAVDSISTARAVVGASQNRLATASSRLQDLQQTATSLLSDTEDADMAKTMVDFSTQTAVYQSALRAGAQIIQPSLMDFLPSS